MGTDSTNPAKWLTITYFFIGNYIPLTGENNEGYFYIISNKLIKTNRVVNYLDHFYFTLS
jgi:lipoprotein NlpI